MKPLDLNINLQKTQRFIFNNTTGMKLAKQVIWETIKQTTQFLQQTNYNESKREFKRMKTQVTDWEKIFAR